MNLNTISFLALVLLLLFSLLNLALMMMMHGAGAQQAYNDVNGYTCSSTALQSQSCTSYTLYRTQSSKETLTSVSTLFNTSASVITTSSSLKVTSNDTSLPSGTPLYIPLACNCVHRRSYQGNESRTTYEATVSWHIVRGNTFWIIANDYYAGLTTYQAIEAANPTQVPTDLHIHSYSTIPLRCACPSATQLRIAKFLLSFVLVPAETSLAVVSSYFNISVADLEAANQVNASTTLQPFSTLLVPLLKLPPLSSIPFVHAPSSFPGSASPKSAAGFPSSPSPSSASSSNKNLYIGVGIGIGLGFFLASMLGICLLLVCSRKKKKMKKTDPGYVAKYNLGFETVKNISATKDSGGDGDSTEYNALLAEKVSDVVGTDKPMVFSYEELREATMNFSDAKRIRGSVFLGKLRGMLVAIKQMKGNNMAQELKILTKVHHSNLVRLVGMCVSSSEHLYLVFEYAENGSLSDCLHNYKETELTANFSQSVAFLPWTRRIQIALDVASGLDYIHNYTNPSFVHKDVKSSNILLDRQFRAKVANFGMAKSANGSGGGGAGGYMAPEYLEHGLVTPKADVFAFGVVLLEILSGKEAMMRLVEGVENGAGKARPLSSQIDEVLEGDNFKEKLQAWMDPLLQNAYPLDTACSVANLARNCLIAVPELRPNMKDINYALSKILVSSLKWESSVLYGTRDRTNISVVAM
ncbi:unnamed protein product [Sphagnum troendelagicum]|uniref:Protein kinase domain-containing protein n=1 Tax=Sphagnum troendelagicum TaxID=128251 RepID=A0ABP0TW58_9BRYO